MRCSKIRQHSETEVFGAELMSYGSAELSLGDFFAGFACGYAGLCLRQSGCRREARLPAFHVLIGFGFPVIGVENFPGKPSPGRPLVRSQKGCGNAGSQGSGNPGIVLRC